MVRCYIPSAEHHSRQGVPTYRTLVQYVPQRPSLLPGTPQDLLRTIRSFRSRRARSEDGKRSSDSIDPVDLAAEWGIDRTYWMRDWSTLSGGEGQRIALAIAIGIGGAEVVLLDGESLSTLSSFVCRR